MTVLGPSISTTSVDTGSSTALDSCVDTRAGLCRLLEVRWLSPGHHHHHHHHHRRCWSFVVDVSRSFTVQPDLMKLSSLYSLSGLLHHCSVLLDSIGFYLIMRRTIGLTGYFQERSQEFDLGGYKC